MSGLWADSDKRFVQALSDMFTKPCESDQEPDLEVMLVPLNVS